ncbi:alkylation response protein AidB-like acyl-CoA dehydrogenase [Amycolatopsis bartoniae]|uniref:Acyl-CoA dehydrogenase n=1 Tax=Amycolatopsis bartoniae TaxID=941986 RepID=A0A8H9M8I7_9PSEU|nr:acyl-CoA dehydrogenase family protein [Amycolatopsis bartoniae]MBB2940240.1 alkylation response protein AidB-like acyl-CoA dehydrogenase [Amycolatopsis bartoniae]TVT10196.1 acyl-CoA dehydrogenase [Amycolatopsis bartoniae]GHF34943.1 acyl-CoA dehydrogenase [Amycolatopsis bartoniae]
MTDFRAEVKKWLAENVPADLDREDVTVRRDWDRKLYEAGYAGLSWPTQHGGRGLGPREEFVFHEEAALAGAPEGYGRVGRLLTGPLLMKHGTDEQMSRFLPPILSGEEIWCQGFSEPEAGSDLANIKTTATREGDEYRINGHKIWTSFGDNADLCLLLARTSPTERRHHNLGMFLLDMRQPGVEVRPIRQITGGSRFSELYFTDAVVHERSRVGGEHDGWKMAMAVLTEERGPADAITRYVSYVGGVQRLERCCAPEDPRVSELRTRVELIRWHALRALEPGEPRKAEVNAVFKLLWSQTWQDLAGFGVSLSCPEHEDYWRHQYLESRGATIYSGTSQIQRNMIGERLLGLPR